MAKLTIEYIRKCFEEEGYTLLEEEYINAKTHMQYICPKGHRHSTTWSNFKHGFRCPYCSHKNTANNQKANFEKIRQAFVSEGYILLSKKEEYKNRHTKLWYRCPKGHLHSISWCGFQQGKRCPYCAGKKVDFITIKETFEREGYILLTTEDEYINNITQLYFICPNNHKHHICWSDFQQGYRCVFCSSSKGEKRVEQYLSSLDMDFTTQKTFENCKHKNKLRFDFYIPILNLCIEYDGEQHYKPIDYFGGEKDFKETQFRDQIKTQYCKDNNINLLRIPYWEFNNIENIICQEIEKLKTFND